MYKLVLTLYHLSLHIKYLINVSKKIVRCINKKIDKAVFLMLGWNNLEKCFQIEYNHLIESNYNCLLFLKKSAVLYKLHKTLSTTSLFRKYSTEKC